MTRTKLTTRRTRRLPEWITQRISQRKNYNKRPYKIKTILPEQKQVDIKKW